MSLKPAIALGSCFLGKTLDIDIYHDDSIKQLRRREGKSSQFGSISVDADFVELSESIEVFQEGSLFNLFKEDKIGYDKVSLGNHKDRK